MAEVTQPYLPGFEPSVNPALVPLIAGGKSLNTAPTSTTEEFQHKVLEYLIKHNQFECEILGVHFDLQGNTKIKCAGFFSGFYRTFTVSFSLPYAEDAWIFGDALATADAALQALAAFLPKRNSDGHE